MAYSRPTSRSSSIVRDRSTQLGSRAGRLALWSLFAITLGAVGCDDSRRVLPEAAGWNDGGPHDLGETVGRDATTHSGPDAAGFPQDGSSGPASCRDVRWDDIDPALHRSCSPTYLGCMEAARTPEDAAACTNRESAECGQCLDSGRMHCAVEAQCQPPLGALECCLAATCDIDDSDCVRGALRPEGACSDSVQTFYGCAQQTLDLGQCPWADPRCLPDEGTSPPPPDQCSGTASLSGSVGPYDFRFVTPRNDAGGVGLVFSEAASVPVGGTILVSRLSYVEGQMSYPPSSGLYRCGFARRTASGWAPGSQGLCELALSELRFADEPGNCTGRIAGVVRALFGTDTLGGAFQTLLPVAQDELSGPSCLPRDARCSSNDDCCARSCNMFLGVCL